MVELCGCETIGRTKWYCPEHGAEKGRKSECGCETIGRTTWYCADHSVSNKAVGSVALLTPVDREAWNRWLDAYEAVHGSVGGETRDRLFAEYLAALGTWRA